MPFSQDEGYVPVAIADILDAIRGYINTQFGTTYTAESFVGTNFYKYFYALAQRMAENETKTSEIFLKLQEYIDITNERISRPVATNPGLIEKLETEGYTASLKPMIDADAGKINVCVDVDDAAPTYAATKLDICTIIKDSTAAGCVTQGAEVEAIVLSNGQKYTPDFYLPTIDMYIEIKPNFNWMDDPYHIGRYILFEESLAVFSGGFPNVNVCVRFWDGIMDVNSFFNGKVFVYSDKKLGQNSGFEDDVLNEILTVKHYRFWK